MASINIKSLNKFYGKTHVIKDFSLEIKDQSFTTLVGPSGCGKSTLLRMIAGLEEVNSGTISINDKQVNDLSPKDRNIAMVFQSYALYPHMTVFDNMAFGLKLEKKSNEEINERVLDAAKTLQIQDYLKRKPKQLSGGQRQRVAIGRAITRKPQVFLFDEPLSNLDAALRVQMRIELAKLHEQLNTTMIYVTHDQTEAMTLSNEIVVLDEGEISQQGNPIELYNNPKNLFVAGFIGSPKMNFINSKVLSIDESRVEISVLGSNITIPKKINKYDDDDDIIFGIRPEDISLENKGEFAVKITIDLIENLGSEKIIYSHLNNTEIRIKSAQNIKDKNITIYFQKNKLYLFDNNKNRLKS